MHGPGGRGMQRRSGGRAARDDEVRGTVGEDGVGGRDCLRPLDRVGRRRHWGGTPPVVVVVVVFVVAFVFVIDEPCKFGLRIDRLEYVVVTAWMDHRMVPTRGAMPERGSVEVPPERRRHHREIFPEIFPPLAPYPRVRRRRGQRRRRTTASPPPPALPSPRRPANATSGTTVRPAHVVASSGLTQFQCRTHRSWGLRCAST